MRFMGMRPFVLALAVAGCWSTSQPPTDPVKSRTAPVEIAIASVRLADDCGDDLAQAKAEVSQGSMAGDCAGDGCSFSRACEQTLLQVSFRSSGSESAAVAIRRVELLDERGHAVGTLTARKPTRWAQSGAYVAWNQVVAGGELLSASYALSAPDWGKLPGGRDPSARYKVRVTFAVGAGEKTVEKQAVVSAFSDPNVVT
jgi:hypothetical protein